MLQIGSKNIGADHWDIGPLPIPVLEEFQVAVVPNSNGRNLPGQFVVILANPSHSRWRCLFLVLSSLFKLYC